MGRFADRILSRTSGPVKTPATETNAFRIAAVHAGSLADEAGLKAEMFYLPGKLTTSPLEMKERASAKSVTSRIVDVAAGEQIELVTQGFPFGMELAKSPAAIARDTLDAFVDGDEIIHLAHTGRVDDFERFVTILAEEKSRKNRDLGAVLKGWFGAKAETKDGRTLSLDAENYMGLVPHAKLLGAFWLAANRNAAGARRLAAAWEHWGVEQSGSDYAALYFLVVGLIREVEGSAGADVQAALVEAYKRAPESKLVLDVMTPRMPQMPVPRVSLKGRLFPNQYRLPEHDPLKGQQQGVVNFASFRDAVEALGEGERHVVVLLGGYRANGFYARMMHRFSELAPLISGSYKSVHVITAFEVGGRHNDLWMLGELKLRKAGAPLKILYDQGDTVSNALRTTRSPHCYVVDREGVVTYDGWMMDEGGFWDGIA